ncbi:O-antigen polymerase [Bacteroides pyogenes]|uniref:O-antigen polymerase n=1 Tax=Bacteroides pyogenes TaxID=310300 RepID=UPI001BA5D6A7|nr:O-antigen polymerase [Bacteroides pyogenes]
MRYSIDLIFVIITTIIVLKAYTKTMSFQNKSMAGFVIFIVYIFNCLPIVFDLVIGIPNYVYYFQPFEVVAKNDLVSVIYDIYMLLVMITLYLYFCKAKAAYLHPNILSYEGKLKYFKNIIIWIPILLFVAYLYTSGISNFIYGSFSTRESDSSLPVFINHSIFFSLYFFCIKYFGQEKKKSTYWILFIYLIVISIINGKRFIIAEILFIYLACFIYSNWSGKLRIKLNRFVIIVSALFMGFMIFYITSVKIMGDIGFDYIYSQLRVDFGREDVVKYVIGTELSNNSILDYRGQSILSLLFMIVPRSIWASKPWPHYRYLTSSIYGTDIDSLTSGITPSYFEMMIANFSLWGIPIAIIVLVIFVKFGDKLINTNQKVIVLLVLIQILTQSMDVIMFIFYYFIYIFLKKSQ